MSAQRMILFLTVLLFPVIVLLAAPTGVTADPPPIGEAGFVTVNFPGAERTTAYGINDDRHVVGQYRDGSGTHGYLYDGTTYTSIEFSNISAITAGDINNNGLITGMYEDELGVRRGYITDTSLSFLTTVYFPGSTSTTLTGINDLGHVVGQYRWPATDRNHAFFFDGTNYVTIHDPGDPDKKVFVANDINNNGDIVGAYEDPIHSWDNRHGFITDTQLSVFTTLDFPGIGSTDIQGINDLGQMVGQQHAGNFYFDGEEFFEIMIPGINLIYGSKINNFQQFVGYHQPTNQEATLAALLGIQASEPQLEGLIMDANAIPEPATLSLLAVGMLMACRRRRASCSRVSQA